MTTEPQAARLGTRGGVSLERGRHYAPNARGAGAEKKGRIVPEIRVFQTFSGVALRNASPPRKEGAPRDRFRPAVFTSVACDPGSAMPLPYLPLNFHSDVLGGGKRTKPCLDQHTA